MAEVRCLRVDSSSLPVASAVGEVRQAEWAENTGLLLNDAAMARVGVSRLNLANGDLLGYDTESY